MTFDEIIARLRTADLPPEDALRAGMAHADALAPLVYDRLAQFCRGVCLLPEDESLLFYGLHVLAAARHHELWPRLVELARAPEAELGEFFADRAPISLAALMLSVWDGDSDGLLRLIEHADISVDGKWALFDVLARLTFDSRIPRATTVGFLERFERDGLADEDDQVWWGWENAVTKLGLTELEPALQRVWKKSAYEHFDQKEHDDCLADLRRAAAAPADPSVFDADGIAPFVDPVAALAWMHARDTLHRQWDAERAAPPPHIASDPAKDIRLSREQQHWLARFLQSRQVPPSTMPLEMLDGFLTALVIGPVEISPAEYLPIVWGDRPNIAAPEWQASPEADRALGLIARLHGAILTRRDAGAPHVPLAPIVDGTLIGLTEWTEGFMAGLDHRENAWNALFEDRRGAEEALAVLALCEGETELLGRPATNDERLQIVERLPRLLQRIAAYWRDPARVYPKSAPVRVQKIGRNDPCPCGSGKKYKKCCAGQAQPA